MLNAGEANSRNAYDYACSFPAMIDDWRQKFNQKSMGETNSMCPFGFVQVNILLISLGFKLCSLGKKKKLWKTTVFASFRLLPLLHRKEMHRYLVCEGSFWHAKCFFVPFLT